MMALMPIAQEKRADACVFHLLDTWRFCFACWVQFFSFESCEQDGGASPKFEAAM